MEQSEEENVFSGVSFFSPVWIRLEVKTDSPLTYSLEKVEEMVMVFSSMGLKKLTFNILISYNYVLFELRFQNDFFILSFLLLKSECSHPSFLPFFFWFNEDFSLFIFLLVV